MTSKTNLRWLKQLEYPLQTVFETWASKSTSRFKSLLHQCVVFHLREPSICSQQEFDQSLVATSEFPGASQKIGKSSSIGLHRVHLGDEDSTLFLRLDPRASYRIIDSLLGSRTYSDSPTAVAFSTLDWQVLSYAMGELLGALQEAWEPIAPIYPKLHAFSPEEDIHRWVPTDSFLLRLEFDLKLNSDDAEGENTHPVSAAGSWYLPEIGRAHV